MSAPLFVFNAFFQLIFVCENTIFVWVFLTELCALYVNVLLTVRAGEDGENVLQEKR